MTLATTSRAGHDHVNEWLRFSFLALLLAAALDASSSPAPVDPGGLPYILVPGGIFEIGCVAEDLRCEPHEFPRKVVRLSADFLMTRTPVTVGAFERFVGETGYVPSSQAGPDGPVGRMYFELGDGTGEWRWVRGLSWSRPLDPEREADPAWPVVQVTSADAEAYCAWAGGALPTEAQWERAARGGRPGDIHIWGQGEPQQAPEPPLNGPDRATAERFPSMETFPAYDDGFAALAPVATFPPNAFGLHDMAGNVYEFTRSRYDERGYADLAAVDPEGPATGIGLVVRGGAWGYAPAHQRISWRGYFSADSDFWTATLGFRCARMVPAAS